MRRRLSRALTLGAAMVFLSLLGATYASAHGKMHCHVDTQRAGNLGLRDSMADPIVFHDRPRPQGHLHTFLGNEILMRRSNPGSAEYKGLVGKPTTCRVAADSAAYWFPMLQQRMANGTWRELPVKSFIAYYRCWSYDVTRDQECSGNRTYPKDARLVAGNIDARGGGDPVTWNCNQNSSRPGPYVNPKDANCSTARPVGGSGRVQLGAHIDFPTCWSGNLNKHAHKGNTADFHGTPSLEVRNQFAYPAEVDRGAVCPARFGEGKVPHLRMTFSWEYQGDGKDLRLASGTIKKPFTMHADFWNTWVQGGLQKMIDDCIDTSSSHPHGNEAVCGS